MICVAFGVRARELLVELLRLIEKTPVQHVRRWVARIDQFVFVDALAVICLNSLHSPIFDFVNVDVFVVRRYCAGSR